MKSITQAQANSFSNSPTCYGEEYNFNDKDLNIALITVNGRYPEAGFATNEVCKEISYVVSGSGSVHTEHESLELHPGDAIMLQPGEKFYWEGKNMRMIMPCSPSFYPEQHKVV